MRNGLLRWALLGGAIAMGQAAWSATYYVSDCQPGAVAGCVAGNDENNGTTKATPWRTTAKVQQVFADLNGDDKILFVRGGVWVDSLMYLQNLNSSAAHPITFDGYTAAWGSTRRPILKDTRPDGGVFYFTNGGTAIPDGGYVVRNLDLQGGGTANSGIFTSQATSDILLANLNIEGFGNGVYCGYAIQRVTLRDSTLRNARGNGVLWSCVNSTIENNLFDHNGSAETFDHSIYIEGPPDAMKTNMVIRNNKLINNVLVDGKCAGVPLVVHGRIDGLLIEHNLVEQASGTATSGCWGIAVDGGYSLQPESFKRVVIRGNRVVNVGGIGIGCEACTAPVIENNTIISSDPNMEDYAGISIPDRLREDIDASDSGAIVRNNSIQFAATPLRAVGIWLAERAGTLPGTNMQVVSNQIRFGPGADGTCFNLAGTKRSDFKAFDNNVCQHTQPGGRYSDAY